MSYILNFAALVQVILLWVSEWECLWWIGLTPWPIETETTTGCLKFKTRKIARARNWKSILSNPLVHNYNHIFGLERNYCIWIAPSHSYIGSTYHTNLRMTFFSSSRSWWIKYHRHTFMLRCILLCILYLNFGK